MTNAEEAMHHLELLKMALNTKTGPANLGPPELVTIDHDDYHAEHVGNAKVWTVELLPGNFMAFNEPWNSGSYDT